MTALGLKALVASALKSAAGPTNLGAIEIDVEPSQRPELSDYQCNAALRLAKALGKPPREIASALAAPLHVDKRFSRVSVDGPGFINVTISDDTLSDALNRQLADPRLGCPPAAQALTVIVDYGGPNIAKPMHVGHLRSSIIGDCLKRLFRFLGHQVTGDIHLGDWGTQVGMVIFAIRERDPALPYFNSAAIGPFPAESPVTLADLEVMYPAVSARSNTDETVAAACRTIIRDLQMGHPGYRALWQHLVAISVADMQSNFHRLDIAFDCWFGESRYNDRVQPLTDLLLARKIAQIDDGAVVIRVERNSDTSDIPPFILRKSDGAALYSTTDLATAEERAGAFGADLVLYVVDERQHLHLEQMFRAVALAGMADRARLEHIGFGTMNGPDGKPFKTRAGGVLKLGDLIEMLATKAQERLASSASLADCTDIERTAIADAVGVATLKFADLQHHRKSNYIFDLDRFSQFEGRTGPYIQYTAVRAKSILRKAADQGFAPGAIVLAGAPTERQLALRLARLSDSITDACQKREPHILCDYLYEVAQLFNKYYGERSILQESNASARGSMLSMCRLAYRVLELGCALIGVAIPDRM